MLKFTLVSEFVNEFMAGMPAENRDQIGHEIYSVGRGISEYCRDNEIGSVIFPDGRARLAQTAMHTYWAEHYPLAEIPKRYFMNPSGFGVEDSSEGELRPVEWDLVEGELLTAYPQLFEGDQKVLIFDSCVHTGDTLTSMKEGLTRAGIKEVHTGVAYLNGFQPSITPDFVVLLNTPAMECTIFPPDRTVKRAYSVTSIVSPAHDETIRAGYDRELVKRFASEREGNKPYSRVTLTPPEITEIEDRQRKLLDELGREIIDRIRGGKLTGDLVMGEPIILDLTGDEVDVSPMQKLRRFLLDRDYN